MASDLPAGFALLILLVSGYIFVMREPVLARKVARYNGQRFYLTVAIFGMILFCLSYILIVALDLLLALVPDNKLFTYNHDSTPSFVIPALFGAFICALFLPWAENQEDDLIKFWKEDDVDWLMYGAMEQHKPVIVSLESRKTYIGLISDGLEPEKERSFITIIPLYSGYRDKDTLNLCLENNYDAVRKRLQELVSGDCTQDQSELLKSEINDYRLVIPRRTIASIGIAAQFGDASDRLETPHSIT